MGERRLGQILVKQAKSGSEVRFFAIFSILVHQFSFKLHRMIAWNNIALLVEVKDTKEFFGIHISAKCAKIGPKIRFFVIFSSLVHQFSQKLHYHDDSLEHCLTNSKGKSHEKNSWVPNWVRNQDFLPFSQGCIIIFP